ncbi:cwf15 cwc15 cell cycle control protein [Cystoisospora suis]|uniref:Cwf15 cwc15 cell cycle control protein n=1 Tax=Cystoisospora suis TaxID=483139 RepID=A0A2C6KRU5_9APIC|nr:cwf15 cwc15 cell cycle control protein [Cystoisospora suis]
MEEEKAKQAIEEKKRQAEQEEKMLRANPLLMQEGEGGGEGGFKTGGVKRRWDDEVVFRNQAKNPPKHTKQFINDPVRSEFHKKFLSKYIW